MSERHWQRQRPWSAEHAPVNVSREPPPAVSSPRLHRSSLLPPPLCPRSELAFQIADQFRALGAGMSLKDCVVVGGLDMQQQAKELARRPHVVVATPGRLRALLQADADLAAAFKRARFLVLDEAG